MASICNESMHPGWHERDRGLKVFASLQNCNCEIHVRIIEADQAVHVLAINFKVAD